MHLVLYVQYAMFTYDVSFRYDQMYLLRLTSHICFCSPHNAIANQPMLRSTFKEIYHKSYRIHCSNGCHINWTNCIQVVTQTSILVLKLKFRMRGQMWYKRETYSVLVVSLLARLDISCMNCPYMTTH